MLDYCRQDLEQLKYVLQQLDSQLYRQSIPLLSGASIGQHTRHIIEFYQCLSDNPQILSYDNRERSSAIENSLVLALERIQQIQTDLLSLNLEQTLTLLLNLDSNETETIRSVESNIGRELVYCLEHSIHHQAIIKIALHSLELNINLPPNFGIAPATIRHQSGKA